MIKQKRGLSGIIVAIILIGLVFLAAGILWSVVRPLIEDPDFSNKCIGLSVTGTSLTCTATDPDTDPDGAGTCSLTVRRSTGSSRDAIDAVYYALLQAEGSQIGDVGSSSGNVALEKTISDIDVNLVANVDSALVWVSVDGVQCPGQQLVKKS